MESLPTNLPGQVHATAVSFQGQAVLLCGRSGAGKSTLALRMLALGAELISDDIVWITEESAAPFANRPPQAKGPLRIEARGFGFLDATPGAARPIRAVVDMEMTETMRLPDPKTVHLGRFCLPLFHKVENPAFPEILMHYLSIKHSELD